MPPSKFTKRKDWGKSKIPSKPPQEGHKRINDITPVEWDRISKARKPPPTTPTVGSNKEGNGT